MEQGKLTHTDIKQLYKFTRSHYVEHYDLQTELVDHLANGIELQWQAHPQRNFEEALNTEFKKFGVFGFHDVIAEKQKAISKRYRRLIWRFFKEWFCWPKTMSTVLSVAILFTLLRLLNASAHKPEIVLTFLLLFSAVFVIYFFFTRAAHKQKMFKEDKKFMLSEMIYNFGSAVIFVQIPVQVGILLNASKNWLFYDMVFDFIFSACMVLLALLVYVIIHVLPLKGEELLSETYAEYKMSQDCNKSA